MDPESFDTTTHEDIRDLSRHEFLQLLDESDEDVSDWNASFIESCLGTKSYTPGQRTIIDQLQRQYPHI